MGPEKLQTWDHKAQTGMKKVLSKSQGLGKIYMQSPVFLLLLSLLEHCHFVNYCPGMYMEVFLEKLLKRRLRSLGLNINIRFEGIPMTYPSPTQSPSRGSIVNTHTFKYIERYIVIHMHRNTHKSYNTQTHTHTKSY
jgi:hypothetical protein